MILSRQTVSGALHPEQLTVTPARGQGDPENTQQSLAREESQ